MLRATTTLLLLVTAGGALADELPPLPPEPAGDRELEYSHPLATPGDWVHDPHNEIAPPLPFRSTALAEEPHWGEDGPSRGYLHYDCPSEHYGIWYRSASFGRGPGERTAPAMWNPRGYGHLFAESSDPYRMDYKPYELADHRTDQGPAYHPTEREYCGKPPAFCCNGWLSRIFRLRLGRPCH